MTTAAGAASGVMVPVTGSIEAIAGLLLLHTPPPAASLNVMVEPIQTADGPVIEPPTGNGLTVNGSVTWLVQPKALVIE